MKSESLVLAIAGVFFGVLVGWIIGSQQAGPARTATLAFAPAATAGQPAAAPGQAPASKPLDQARADQLRATAMQEPRNEQVRVELGNLYFDADRFGDAATWYEQALEINPKDPDVSTDLGVSYYYLNDPDKALKQFDYSLSVDPGHAKTMLNMGVVRAFGKQDLKGAVAIWEQLLKTSPDSQEGQAARRALDGLKSAHPEIGGASATPPGSKPGA